MMSRNEQIQILEDGKNDWVTKKMSNEDLRETFVRLANKKENEVLFSSFIRIAERLYFCGTYLEFKQYEDGIKKLDTANFCRIRLCPMCTWRRNKKVFGQVSRIVNEIDKMNKYDYIFLTLTCKNIKGNELSNQMDILNKSFNNMFRGNKKVKKILQGYFRANEVTYNAKENTYHPHIHCIIVVEKGYFHWRNENYIKTEEWANIWQHYLEVDYIPIVDVRKVKANDYKYKAVCEIAKYTIKSKDIIIKRKNGQVNEQLTDENVYNLYLGLKNKRLVGMGGIFKELHKKLNLEDINDDNIDLIHTDVDDNNKLLNFIILKYKWSVGFRNYVLVQK